MAGSPPPPLPTTVRAFIFIARIIIQRFLPSSTRVEQYVVSNHLVCFKFFLFQAPLGFESLGGGSVPVFGRFLYGYRIVECHQ